MVLQMENVIANDEFEGVGQFRGADKTIGVKLVFGDVRDEAGEQAVARIPGGNDGFPGHLAIAVNADPVVLGVSGTAVSALERRVHKADVVVGGGIDQVAEFLLWGTKS